MGETAQFGSSNHVSKRATSSAMATRATGGEWSRYYRDERLRGVEVLHACFVRHRYPRHTHDYAVVAFVERGAASYWYRGAQRTAAAGQIFFVNAGEPHTGDPVLADGYVYRVLYPQLDYLAQVARDVGAATAVRFFKGAVIDDSQLSSLLSKFHSRLESRAPAAECESLLLHALARLITKYGDPLGSPRAIGSERPAVKAARDFMEIHFAEDVSISRLSGLSSLSPYYFARAFEREVGLPPHAYLESVRIRKVREFIDRGHSLVSAALSAGFVDQSHLTHRFKRILGITPGQYIRDRNIQQDRQRSLVQAHDRV
jgi:AraC-like DNA-binding protein